MSAACSESERLLNAYGTAVQELFMFQEQHFAALVDGDEDARRYELLIHMAGEKRQAAKYAYLRHVEEHGCEKAAQEAVAEFAQHIQPPERRKRADAARNLKRRILDLLPGD